MQVLSQSGVQYLKLTGVPGSYGPAAISAPGLKVGDFSVQVSPSSGGPLFENVISVDDEIQYVASMGFGDNSGNTYDFVFIRGVLPY